MNSINIVLIITLCLITCYETYVIQSNPRFHTVVTTKNVTDKITKRIQESEHSNDTKLTGNFIDVQVIQKPHNLFIGRCLSGPKSLHGENIILNNDGKSHVSADININVEGPVNITCVKVLDQSNTGEAYPSYIGGGVGYNYVTIGVTTQYGKGFNFFIQVFGYENNTTINDYRSNRT